MEKAEQTLWAAWLPNLSVLDIWDLIVEPASEDKRALITMLDSSDDVAKMPAIEQLADDYGCEVAILDSGVILDNDCFAALRSHGANFFTGFDEIWWPRDQSVAPKPGTFRLTSEIPISDGPEPGLGQWMYEAGIRLGLGDGCGVNVATFETSIASKLSETYSDVMRMADGSASW